MVNYPHNDLFNRGDTDRQLRMDFTGGTITNKEMHQGTFTLTESLCSEECLTFGACESSVLSFKVHNVLTPLAGQELSVYEVLNGNTAEPFHYGKYKVHSDKPTADRRYRDVVAYDAMYDILNADVASWYNSLTFPCSIGYFRKKFLSYLKVEYVDTELINDGIYIQKTVEVEQLSGKQVINAICELNGCFGHINRQGKFEFVVLKPISTGLYPSETLYPSENLYPREANSAELLPKSRYSACKYEDFETKFITGVQIRQEEDDIGATVGTTTNVYVVEDNFLVYGKSHNELTEIANNLLSVIDNIYYRPIEYVKTNGKPYLEVGDNISVGSSEIIIETYILERTLKGVVGQKDEFSAKGTETYPKKLNGLNKQITQLKGKTNKLIRTVDETRLEMEDIEKGLYSEISITAGQIRTEISNSDKNLQSQITQNAGSISSEITRATNAENALSTRITQTDEKIRLDVSNTYETITNVDNKVTGAKGYTDEKLKSYSTTVEMNASIQLKADSITSTVSEKYYTKTDTDTKVTSLQSQITQNATGITAEVTRAKDAEDKLSASIKLNADAINLRVKSADLISEINLSEEAIVLKSNRLIVESTNFTLDANGNVKITGEINAESGKIGGSSGFTITSKSFYSGKESISSSSSGVYVGTDGIACGTSTDYWVPTGLSSWTKIVKPSFQVTSDGEVYVGTGQLTLGSGTTDLVVAGNGIIELYENINTSSYHSLSLQNDKIIIKKGSSQQCTITEEAITVKKSLTSTGKRFDVLADIVNVGYEDGKLGFFEETPVLQQSVTAISSTSTATTATIATTVNNIITALKNYGLLS